MPHDLLFTSLLRAGSLLLSASSPLPSAFAFSLESSKFNGDQMTFCPEPSLPCSSDRLLPPAPASRVAQFAGDNANSATPDLLFTSLLRAGSPSSRETAAILKHLTHYLRHFCEAGPPGSRETMNSCTADLQFTSLLRAGSPSSRETAPTPGHLTYYLRHFGEPGRPVRERQDQFRDT